MCRATDQFERIAKAIQSRTAHKNSQCKIFLSKFFTAVLDKNCFAIFPRTERWFARGV